MGSKQIDLGELAAALSELGEAATRNLSVPEFTYHVTVIPDSGDAVYKDCDTVGDAVEFLKGFHGHDVECLVFYGRACTLTDYPVSLVTHEGNFPLYDDDGGPGHSVVGRLGAPGVVVIPAAQQDPQQEDEDDGGNEDRDDDG